VGGTSAAKAEVTCGSGGTTEVVPFPIYRSYNVELRSTDSRGRLSPHDQNELDHVGQG
jgi:hypothetical protein